MNAPRIDRIKCSVEGTLALYIETVGANLVSLITSEKGTNSPITTVSRSGEFFVPMNFLSYELPSLREEAWQ